jgi:hypothetical protein
MPDAQLMSKEVFIEVIKTLKDRNKELLVSNIPLKVEGARKNKKGEFTKSKSISFQFPPSYFKDPEKIHDLINSTCFGVIVLDRKFLSDGAIKKIKEAKKNK